MFHYIERVNIKFLWTTAKRVCRDLSTNVTNDVLETPFTTEEVSNLCLKLPNGGLDELVHEHVMYAGKQFFVVPVVFNAFRALEAFLNLSKLLVSIPYI